MTAASRDRPQGFGFQPEESEHHFIVTIPARRRDEVLIAEHLTFVAGAGYAPPSLGIGIQDAKLRVALARVKWDAIADAARVEFNRRLKKHHLATGRWKRGANAVARLIGKELTLLAWAVEDADPALIPTAIRNWLGLAPEERWWLFTMTNAATGHALHGRNRGWRKAVRFALTENPVTTDSGQRQADLFRLVAADPANRTNGRGHRPQSATAPQAPT